MCDYNIVRSTTWIPNVCTQVVWFRHPCGEILPGGREHQILDKDHLKSTLRLQSDMRLSNHERLSSERSNIKPTIILKKHLLSFIRTGPELIIHSDRIIIPDTCSINIICLTPTEHYWALRVMYEYWFQDFRNWVGQGNRSVVINICVWLQPKEQQNRLYIYIYIYINGIVRPVMSSKDVAGNEDGEV